MVSEVDYFKQQNLFMTKVLSKISVNDCFSEERMDLIRNEVRKIISEYSYGLFRMVIKSISSFISKIPNIPNEFVIEFVREIAFYDAELFRLDYIDEHKGQIEKVEMEKRIKVYITSIFIENFQNKNLERTIFSYKSHWYERREFFKKLNEIKMQKD